MNPVKTILLQIYLLQLENYDLRRYLRAVNRVSLLRPLVPRQKIVWTAKLLAVSGFGGVLAVFAAFAIAASFSQTWAGGAALLVVLIADVFVFSWFLVVADLLLRPLDYLVKSVLVARARAKLVRLGNLKIIGITGSYGKTSMKAVLAAILSEKFSVVQTPDSVNTPVGIARVILRQLRADTEIFIAEMGAYRRGDIAQLCGIAKPDIAVLTGINEAHLERFGILENTILGKFELLDQTRPGGTVLLNIADRYVRENYQAHLGGRTALFFGDDERQPDGYEIKHREFDEDGGGIGFELVLVGENLGRLQVPFLGEYILHTIAGASLLAKRLGVSAAQIRAGIGKLQSVAHRLQLVPSSKQFLIIDDSYNGNPAGVREAISVLGRFRSRRKLYLTPGLVEMGGKTRQVHQQIGRQLAGVADLVLLIRNSVTPFVADGLKQAGFPDDKLKWFASAAQAHGALPDLLLPGDVILFQNDWPDNYF